MTDGASPYGALIDAVERHRAEMLRLERTATSEVLRAYGKVWARLKTRVTTLAKQHRAAIDAGELPQQVWIADYQRTSELMAQVEAEIRRLHDQVYRGTVRAQSRAIEASERHFRDVLAISGDAYGGGQGIASQWARVPLDAMRDMVGATRKGTPLRALLDALGVEASRNIREELITGLALGEGPRAVARRIRGALGGDLSRALRISRTETLRAYRSATHENYEANEHIIQGWRWLAAKQARTCAACLALDGTWHPNSETLQDHPNGRCVALPSLRGRDDPNAPAPWETGSQWLEKQSPEVQQRVLGKAGQAAYASGAVKLDDFVGQRDSPLWGTTIQRRGLTSIVGADEAQRWEDMAAGRPTRDPDAAAIIPVDTAVGLISEAHASAGGCTFNLYEGDLTGRQRYAVSLYPERSTPIKGASIDRDTLRRYINDNLDLLADRSNSVGTWYSADQDITYLDVSATLDDLDLALEAGKLYNQIAIFDLSRLEEIATGGNGEPIADTLPALERLRRLMERRGGGAR